MGQRDLLRRVRAMGRQTVAELLERTAEIAPIARAGSNKAKLFAALRFCQEKGELSFTEKHGSRRWPGG